VQLIPLQSRIDSIDILRGIALLGVLIVNLVTGFRVSVFQQLIQEQPVLTLAESLAQSFVTHVLEFKAFVLFSLLFGLGMAIQFERFSLHGNGHALLVRRLIVLLGFGLLHLCLVWNGDILTEYALVGLCALPFVNVSTPTLITAAIFALGLHCIWPFLPQPFIWPNVARANQAYGSGSYADVVRFGLAELPWIAKLHYTVLPRTFTLFLIGMIAWRSGILQKPARFTFEFSVTALVFTALGFAMTLIRHSGLAGWWPVVMAQLAPIVLAVGYGAGVLALANGARTQNLMAVFASLGRMAFTNYLLQSAIFSFVFFGYGLGQFGKLDILPALALGACAYITQIFFSTWWLNRFSYGPLEWVWRSLTYGTFIALQKSTTKSDQTP
jgi:uncharacterized protein